jgi:hypothetical protein
MSSSYNYREKKVVAILAKTLTPGVALNVLGHLAISLGAHCEDNELMGATELPDAAGVVHRGISKYPVIITQVKQSTVRRSIEHARQNARLFLTDYPKQMLETGHDDDLASAIASTNEKDMEYLGAIIFGPAEDVDQITRKYSLWR